MSNSTQVQAEHSDGGPTTTDVVALPDLSLAQVAFARVLDMLKQFGLYERSPKFFVIYAHENDELKIQAHKSVVTDYISWFKEIFFDVDSDKSPHGYRMRHSVAHPGASFDIVQNQICLLPQSWHKENVDCVLVFYSELLAHYMEDERRCKVNDEQTYMGAVFSACDKYRSEHPPRWEEVRGAVAEARKKYSSKMDGKFHHVLTELALLKFRHSIPGPQDTIPVLLFEHKEQREWKPKFLGMEDTRLRVSLKAGEKHRTFFKILKRFETLEPERPLIEELERCYQKCEDLLIGRTPQLAEYKTQIEVEISQALRHLNDSKHLRKIERPVNKRTIRDTLNLHSMINYASAKRISGEQLPENLDDIVLSVDGSKKPNNKPGDDPKGLEQESKTKLERRIVLIHNLFDEITVEDETRVKKKIRPKRILIHGKPGVGKSTLSRRIMYEYSWHPNPQVKFDLVVLIPVRKLGQFADLADLLFDEYFRGTAKGRELSNHLQKLLLNDIGDSTILLILDGLDEALQWSPEKRSLLEKLMSRSMLIITSRFYETNTTPSIDLTLEALGLRMESIEAYVRNTKILPEDASKHILDLISKSPFIKEMVQVPLHLDILCYSWDELRRQAEPFMATQSTEELDTLPITALYQAVVHALWRKDIPGLGKLDNGEALTHEIVEAINDPARLERVVSAESTLLEEICVSLMKSDEESGEFEFDIGAVNKVIGSLESSGTRLPLSLERNLYKLSFLHADHQGRRRSFSFIHLTFQEFFAAKGLVKDQERLKDYIRRYKYNRRFERVWRFVAGLLQTKNDINQLYTFFAIIQAEPRDLLGPAHQRLIMSCLSEATPSMETTLFSTLRTGLETQLEDWLVFECQFTGGSALAMEGDCPSRVLDNALRRQSDVRVKLLKSIATRPRISPSTIARVVELLKLDFSQIDLIYASFRVLEHQSQELFPDTLDVVAECFTSGHILLKYLAIKLLQKQPCLPARILEKLIAARPVRSTMGQLYATDFSQALRGQPTFPQDILTSLVNMLKHKETAEMAMCIFLGQSDLPLKTLAALLEMLRKREVMYLGVPKIFGVQSTLHGDIWEDLVTMLRSEKANGDRSIAVEILKNRFTLPPYILEILFSMLQNDRDRNAAVEILKKQSTLPLDRLKALVAMLQNHSSRETAVKILQHKRNLPLDILADLMAMLRGCVAREAALKILRFQSALPRDSLKALVTMLQNSISRDAAVEILQGQSTLPPDILADLITILRDNTRNETVVALEHPDLPPDVSAASVVDHNTRAAVARVVEDRLDLPPGTLPDLAAIFQDTDAKEVAAKAVYSQMEQAMQQGRKATLTVLAILDQILIPKASHQKPLDISIIELQVPRSKQNVLKDSVELLKDEHTRKLGVCFLKSCKVFPKKIYEDIAAMLEDKNRGIRRGAAEAIEGHRILPLFILAPLAALFGEPETQPAATAAFKHQLILPRELKIPEMLPEAKSVADEAIEGKAFILAEEMEVLAESLLHTTCDIRICRVESMSSESFGSQSTISPKILRRAAKMLKSSHHLLRDAAAILLRCQPTFPKEIHKEIMEGLEDEVSNSRWLVSKLLSDRSVLPIRKLVYDVRNVNGLGFLLRWALEGPTNGEWALPEGVNDKQNMQYLYSAWLHESLKGNMAWYVDGDVSYIETSGQRITIRLSSHIYQFLDTIRQIQIELGVPFDETFWDTRFKIETHSRIW
ncbi:hypothetical protein O1611_g2309 [Lasiodiplodia mahajangana]|uniref:Uncharacterized protein n=1 Tax=Lasiodiplodia mahajangana TaxID=1108764 RepID=A0ACC2JVM6_9PEZI|nr:hypothetical protein O1611_g2309 [Lasiodiplodia mahajangana]